MNCYVMTEINNNADLNDRVLWLVNTCDACSFD